MPPKAEQRAIAAFLDRETARIDALVAKKEQLIELLQEQRTALITRAVTKGLDPNVPMKDSGVEWLGGFRRIGRLRHIETECAAMDLSGTRLTDKRRPTWTGAATSRGGHLPRWQLSRGRPQCSEYRGDDHSPRRSCVLFVGRLRRWALSTSHATRRLDCAQSFRRNGCLRSISSGRVCGPVSASLILCSLCFGR